MVFFCYFAVTHVSSGTIPTPRTHIVGCFVLLLKLAWFTVPSSGCVLFQGLLISVGYRCVVGLVFSEGTSWFFFWWFLLLLLWLVSPSPSYSTFSGTQSGDLHSCSSSLWPSSGYCSHLVLPHLWPCICLSLSPVWLYLDCCRRHVYLLWAESPTK